MIAIDLWFWRLDGPGAALAALLSPDETARAARFVNPAHGDAYRVGRGRLRRILAGYTGQDPAALAFDYNPQGKPALADGPSFNLSHSGGLAALAVTRQALALGLDIEAPRPVEEGVARRFFTAAEQGALADWPDHDWLGGFFRIWTRKEAIVKGCGPGLSMPLSAFDVSLGLPPRLQRMDHPGQSAADWRMIHLDLDSGHLGALAVQARGQPVALTLREAPPGVAVDWTF